MKKCEKCQNLIPETSQECQYCIARENPEAPNPVIQTQPNNQKASLNKSLDSTTSFAILGGIGIVAMILMAVYTNPNSLFSESRNTYGSTAVVTTQPEINLSESPKKVEQKQDVKPKSLPKPKAESYAWIHEKANYGADWPFTVDEVRVLCNGNAVFLVAEINGWDKTYYFNGTSQSIPGHRDLEEIWLPDPQISGARKSISVIMDKATRYCGIN